MLESKIQADCYKWYNNTFCLAHHKPRNLIFAIPNENQQRLRAQGVLDGISDLLVIHYGELHWVEMKSATGRQRPKQRIFEQRVKDSNLGTYHICRSLDEFKKIFVDDNTKES